MPETILETQTETDLKQLAQDIVQRAMRGGATAAECAIREGDEFSTLVRLGEVETLKESGSKSIGVRVFNGKRAANSHAYAGEFRRSYCSIAAMPVAQDTNGGMQSDYWISVARSMDWLESPAHVGKVAADRTVRRLGARKVKTQQVPLIFDPLVASS